MISSSLREKSHSDVERQYQFDRAVLAAYAEVDPEGSWSEDWAEFWTETGPGQPLPAGHVLTARRPEIDERVLANLLRLNLARSSK